MLGRQATLLFSKVGNVNKSSKRNMKKYQNITVLVSSR